MIVTIKILGGAYADVPAWTGHLFDAPVTYLIPEGIVSARTSGAAVRMRHDVAALLDTHDRVEVGAAGWAIRITREASDASR